MRHCGRFTQCLLFFGTIGLLATLVLPAQAQEEMLPSELEQLSSQPDVFYRALVTRVIEEKNHDTLGIAGAPAFSQKLRVQLLTGPKEGSELEMDYGGLKDDARLREGEKVIVLAPNGIDDPERWHIFDRYRLTSLYSIIGFFFVLTIIFARGRGVTSLLGLGISILVLTVYIVPQLLAGRNTLFVILTGSLVIATVSIYLAHGFTRRTTVALGSTLITVCGALLLSFLFVWMAKLFGTGSEEAFYLQTAPVAGINLKGLLLGGIIVGALGVLDDITTAQAAAVDELAKANPAFTRRDLFRRGLSIGREHITSLVNTLVLAYAGASFPALLLFTIYERPLWVVMNTEVIAEEVIRTLVGSIALMCAVPLTTALAAYFLSAATQKK